MQKLIFASLLLLFLAAQQQQTLGHSLIEKNENGTLYCDALACPETTYICKIIEKTQPENCTLIVKTRYCLDQNNTVLDNYTTIHDVPICQMLDSVIQKTIDGGSTKFFNFVSYESKNQTNGNSTEIIEKIEDINRRIHEDLEQTDKVFDEMRKIMEDRFKSIPWFKGFFSTPPLELEQEN